MKWSKLAMVAAILFGIASAASAAELAALPKRAVGIVMIQNQQEKGEQAGAQSAKKQVAWKCQMTVPNTQTSSFAAAELAALTAYVQEGTGTDIAVASSQKDPKTGDYLIEVVVSDPVSTGTDVTISPSGISGLVGIYWTSNCQSNSRFEARFQPEALAKLGEKDRTKTMETVRALAAFNHGLPMTTQAALTKPTIDGDKMIIEICFPKEAFVSQAQAIGNSPFAQVSY